MSHRTARGCRASGCSPPAFHFVRASSQYFWSSSSKASLGTAFLSPTRTSPFEFAPAALGSVLETTAPVDSPCLSVFPSSVNPRFRCCPCVGPVWLRETPTVTARFQTQHRDIAVIRRIHRIFCKSNGLCFGSKPRSQCSVRSAPTVL
jgi:hypothetical protein